MTCNNLSTVYIIIGNIVIIASAQIPNELQ